MSVISKPLSFEYHESLAWHRYLRCQGNQSLNRVAKFSFETEEKGNNHRKYQRASTFELIWFLRGQHAAPGLSLTRRENFGKGGNPNKALQNYHVAGLVQMHRYFVYHIEVLPLGNPLERRMKV
ncbi:hypothetical protein RUM44_009999 [Polyplax serrata]|uniref:Uncharacterized protein n=1 Tax=Polyplax serrata TaxID=468196 RepID=A0ABR1AUC9_POLSC